MKRRGIPSFATPDSPWDEKTVKALPATLTLSNLPLPERSEHRSPLRLRHLDGTASLALKGKGHISSLLQPLRDPSARGM